MNNKKLDHQDEQNSKKNLTPLVEKYVGLMVEDLLANKVIELASNVDEKKLYRLSSQTVFSTVISDPSILDEHLAIQNILDFRDLSKSIYINLNDLNAEASENLLISTVIKFIVNQSKLRIPNLDSPLLQSILNKGKILLDDKDIQKEAIHLLEIQNNFPTYVASILEYYVCEVIKKEFPESIILPNFKIGENEIDLVVESQNINTPTLLFEIKYRKKGGIFLKEDLYNACEKFIRYDRTNRKDTILILIVFTDEGSDESAKLEYRFKQYLEESFKSYSERIFLISLFTKNSNLLKNELVKLKSKFPDISSNSREFILNSQQRAVGSAEDDDQVYSEILNLSKYSYEVQITPLLDVAHWRVGLQFSQNDYSLSEYKRHSNQKPLVHLEKNKDSDTLKISYYDEKGAQQIISEPILALNYTYSPISFLIDFKEGQALIEVLDKNRESILSTPIKISNFSFFRIAAWADGKNKFQFKILLKERKLRISKGTLKLINKDKSDVLSIRVEDDGGNPIANCHILILADNNNFHESYSLDTGLAQIVMPNLKSITLLAAHPSFPSSIFLNLSLDYDFVLTLPKNTSYGSIICSNGTSYVPGLEGRLNPILETSFRKYLYADNIAIDGGKQQPVTFEIDEPLFLVDKHEVSKKVIFRFVRGRSSILDFI